MMATYHERVARRMADSHSVGSYCDYDLILESLLRQFSEQELRYLIQTYERRVRATVPGWRFLPEDQH